jgi:hypothetical protein
MTTKLALGIDPGSHYLGVAIAVMDSGSPVAVPGGFKTLEPASHKLLTGKRLKSLGKALKRFLEHDISALVGSDDWYLTFVSIEDPSSSTYSRARFGADGKKQHDNHKTQLILGRSMQEASHVCEDYADAFVLLNPTVLSEIPIIEVEPSDASEAVGCKRNASKLDRNIAVCHETGGSFEYPRNTKGEPKPDAGSCVRGPLHGAGPDALDAYAALVAGWGKLKIQRFEQMANNAQGQPSNVRRNQSTAQSKRGGGGRNRPPARRDTPPVLG